MPSISGKYKVTLLQENTKKTTFKSQQTRKIYEILHNVNCTISFVLHLIECILCYKQYGSEAETSFNIRLNNHRMLKKPTQ